MNAQDDTLRSRTITWSKPAPNVDLMKQVSGLESLRQAFGDAQRAAPIGRLMDFRTVSIDFGRVVFEGEPAEFHYNPIGTVHGGYAATLLDSCMGCSVHSALKVGYGYTTVELKVNYVRALTAATGTVTAEGKIINVGSRIATAEGRLVGSDGKLYAHGSTTCLVFPL